MNRIETVSLVSIILACFVQIFALDPLLILVLVGVGYFWALSPSFGRYGTLFHFFVISVLIPNFVITSLVIGQFNWPPFLSGKISLLDLLMQRFRGSSFYSLAGVSYGLSSDPLSLLYSYYSPIAVGFLFALALALAMPFLTYLTLQVYSLLSAVGSFLQTGHMEMPTPTIPPSTTLTTFRAGARDTICLRLHSSDFGRGAILALAFSLNLLLLPSLQVLQRIATPAGVVLLPLLSFFSPSLGIVGLALERSDVLFKGEESLFSRRYFSFLSKFIPIAIGVQSLFGYLTGGLPSLVLLWPVYFTSVGATLALISFLPLYSHAISKIINGSTEYCIGAIGMFVVSIVTYYALLTQKEIVSRFSSPAAQETIVAVLLIWVAVSQVWTIIQSTRIADVRKQERQQERHLKEVASLHTMKDTVSQCLRGTREQSKNRTNYN